jgi:hypothetical protein
VLLLFAGMNISVQLFAVKWKMIVLSIVVLLAGKLAVMVAAGQMFGLSRMAALRAGEVQDEALVGWQSPNSRKVFRSGARDQFC